MEPTQQAAHKPFQRRRISMACMSGTRGEHPCRMLKKAERQDRSKLDGNIRHSSFVKREGVTTRHAKTAFFAPLTVDD